MYAFDWSIFLNRFLKFIYIPPLVPKLTTDIQHWNFFLSKSLSIPFQLIFGSYLEKTQTIPVFSKAVQTLGLSMEKQATSGKRESSSRQKNKYLCQVEENSRLFLSFFFFKIFLQFSFFFFFLLQFLCICIQHISQRKKTFLLLIIMYKSWRSCVH